MIKFNGSREHLVWYTIGTICYLLSLASLGLCVFLVPYFYFKLRYNVPEFIINIYNKLIEIFDLSDAIAKLYILIILSISAIIFAYISKIIARLLEPKENE